MIYIPEGKYRNPSSANTRAKKLYLIVAFPLIVITFFVVTGPHCFRRLEYSGNYPELWSIAQAAIPSATGFTEDGFGGQPGIEIIETDRHGRVMFRYIEGGFPSFLVIMQKSDDNYAYFYEKARGRGCCFFRPLVTRVKLL